jgi:hypothetical protein
MFLIFKDLHHIKFWDFMPVIKSVPWVQLYINGDGTLKGTRVVGLHSTVKENMSFDSKVGNSG